MRTLTLASILALIALNAIGQQEPAYNNHIFNPYINNPARVHKGYYVHANLVSRNNMIQMPGSPSANALTIDGPLKPNKMGAGLKIYSDRVGISRKLGALGSYSYRVKLAKDHGLSFGLSAGYFQNKILMSKKVVPDEGDPVLQQGGAYNGSTVDGNFGLHYSWEDKLDIGLGVEQLIGNSIDYSVEEGSLSYGLARHYFVNLRYHFHPFDDDAITLSPLIVLRGVQNAPQPQEGGLIYDHRDKYFAAVTYRRNLGMAFTGGIKVFDKLRIGYSYEVPTNQVSDHVGGTHEISIGYSFELLSRRFDRQSKKIEKMKGQMQEYRTIQKRKNAMQDSLMEMRKKEMDTMSQKYQEMKEELDSIDKKVEKTQKELDQLKKDLRESGALKKGKASAYETMGGEKAPKGYYLVVASVKEANFDKKAMKKKYLSKGYKVVHDKKEGWYYVYKERTEEFAPALARLKELKKGDHQDAWIHVLK